MTEQVESQNNEEKQIIQENTTDQTQTPAGETPESENPNEVNWKKFREKRKEERQQLAEKERELARKKEEAEALKKALEVITSPQQQNPVPGMNYQYYEEQQTVPEDQKIMVLVENLIEKREKEREERRRQEEHAQYPQRLNQNYSDFKHVVNTENLDYLEFHYPEVAKPLAMLPDSYDKWEGIYKAVKRFIPNLDKEKDMKKIDKNLSKPVAMSRPGMSSSSEQAPHISLSDDQKAKNWERIRKMMKGV